MQTYQLTRVNNLSHPHMGKRPPLRIALIANLIDDFERDPDEPPDAGAEFDRLQTIEAIAGTLES